MKKSLFLFGIPSLITGSCAVLFLTTNNTYPTEELQQTQSLFNIANKNNIGPSQIQNTSKKLGNVSIEEGSKKINIIQDYAVSLYTSCGAGGTGWFLDWKIPENSEKYPTKWFVATNAHVLSNFYFKNRQTNYEQELPRKWLRGSCLTKNNPHYTDLFLYKELRTESDSVNKSKTPEEWLLEALTDKHQNAPITAKDATLKHISNDNENLWYIRTDPKLFWVPINFLGNNWEEWWFNDSYHKDFAILEIDFPTEESAKIITDDLYNKLKDKKIQELDFLAPEVFNGTNAKEIEESSEAYYVAGFPFNAKNPFRISGNFSHNRKDAGRLAELSKHGYADRQIKDANGNIIKGHYDARFAPPTQWGGKNLRRFGYNYAIDGSPLGGGASGSLATNSKGNVIGLLSMGILDVEDVYESLVFIEPLRSNGMYNGKQTHPAFDLIVGVDGQKSSYKSQLEKHYPTLKTNLRNKWEHRSKK